MFYFPMVSSSFKQDEIRLKLINELKNIKDDVDNLVKWNKQLTDERNANSLYEKEGYNQDYIELQTIINKIIMK